MKRKLPGWVGALGIVAWVWYWDWNHETITSWFWRHPVVGFITFSWIWSHMVARKPRRILIWW